MISTPVLYASDYCPFCHSTRLVLAAKGVEYRLELLDLGKKGNFRRLLSPYGWVPVYVDGERSIYESLVINEYLDEVHTTPRLMPDDPADKAKVRFWCDFVMKRIVTSYFALMNCENDSEWPAHSQTLNHWLGFANDRAFENTWFGSTELSLADFAMYPWFERFISVERYRQHKFEDHHTKINTWLELMQSTTVVQACAKPAENYVMFFDRYYTPV